MATNDPATAFGSACGATGPLEIEVEDLRRGETKSFSIPQAFVVVGRAEHADLPLDDGEVSRRHAYLQVLGGRVFALDLASRTGLTWEGAAARSGWLGRGQALGIGPFRLRVVAGVPDLAPDAVAGGDPLAACLTDPDGLPPVTLEDPSPGSRRLAWRMNRVLTLVGRSPACKLRVAAGAGSRFVCTLVRTPAGVWVIDLLGRPGIRVNDVPVRCAPLRDGDRLGVGGVTLRVRCGPGAVGPAVGGGGRALAPVAVQPPGLVSALPPGLVAPGLPADRDALTALLLPLAGQFACMQQQMFDQFSQLMEMMGQMFGDLQRDQLGLIRDELARLQQVSQELRELQTEAARTRAAPAPDPSPAPSPHGASPLSPATNGHPTAAPPVSPRQGEAASAPAERSEGPAASPGPSDPDVHARLYQRIQQLQQEKEGRWQRLFGSLFGKRPGDTPT